MMDITPTILWALEAHSLSSAISINSTQSNRISIQRRARRKREPMDSSSQQVSQRVRQPVSSHLRPLGPWWSGDRAYACVGTCILSLSFLSSSPRCRCRCSRSCRRDQDSGGVTGSSIQATRMMWTSVQASRRVCKQRYRKHPRVDAQRRPGDQSRRSTLQWEPEEGERID